VGPRRPAKGVGYATTRGHSHVRYDRERLPLTILQQAALDALPEDGTLKGATEIARELGRPPNGVNSALMALGNKGRVERVPPTRGRWRRA
jgi:hypothetical protein